MAKNITVSEESRQAILRGVDSLANAVKVTLGPRGRNVILGKSFGSPTITKDGVTVAREIELKNRLENLGSQMVREVASKTSDVAGDGTTTATIPRKPSIARSQQRRSRGESQRDQARHRESGRDHRRLAEGAIDARDRRHDRPGRHDLGQPRRDHRPPHRRGDGESRQGRRHHRRGIPHARDDARGRRGAAIDRGTSRRIS